MLKTATISNCGQYRYDLTRQWGGGGGTCCFIGLNPSTADAKVDDPTIRRCVGFAKMWGYGRLVMLNAYAYRATNPNDMIKATDPVGPCNDWWLAQAKSMYTAQVIVAAWGTNIDSVRQKQIIDIIPGLMCLKTTKHGFPSHPLYLPKNLTPKPFYAKE